MDKTKTIAIVGAGTSLTELPKDFIFSCDTFTLNASSVAPQFYDYRENAFHHSWTYAIMVDSTFIKWQYFPEKWVYEVSVDNANNGGGTLFLSRKISNLPNKIGVEVIADNEMPHGCGVLGAALKKSVAMGYRRIVLAGIDFCRRNRQRYWWENTEYESGVMEHERNKTAVCRATHDKWVEYNGHPDTDGETWYEITWRKGVKIIVHPVVAPNGETVYVEKMYKNHLEVASMMINNYIEKGIEICKFSDKGMLQMPVIEKVEAI